MAALDRQVQLEIAQAKGQKKVNKEIAFDKMLEIDPNIKGQHIMPAHSKINNKLIKLSTMQ